MDKPTTNIESKESVDTSITSNSNSKTSITKLHTLSPPQKESTVMNSSTSEFNTASEAEDDVEKWGPNASAKHADSTSDDNDNTEIDDDSIIAKGEVNSLARTESNAKKSAQISRALTNQESIDKKTAKQEAEGVPIPPMGGDFYKEDEYPDLLPDVEKYTVAFTGPKDPMHPHNWPLKKKIIQCLIIGYETFCISFGSSIFASDVTVVAKIYDVANVVATLGVSLYVFGFASGPLVWAPLSELYGRKYVMVISSLLFTIFNFAVATSDRLESILICRFFAGCLGAAPMVCVPASFADMFDNGSRGTVLVLFAMCIIVGPMTAPFVSAFIVTNENMGWRWTSFMIGIISAPVIILIPLFFTETHHPIILVEKAREIRRRTGIWGIQAPHDRFTFTIQEVVQKTLTRPLRMLFTEPILFLISLYMSFIYGMVFNHW
ncbi:unnamed protein product [Ambrosiozyma monospora]|uniref:Unnamed protein product n=1 Tax=Ambrosiozyma monospora TaxID=43982 RepID=A0ACB5TMY1_AMBMO|nr:unnamed protein product [Ambrosiozyma monospora]